MGQNKPPNWTTSECQNHDGTLTEDTTISIVLNSPTVPLSCFIAQRLPSCGTHILFDGSNPIGVQGDAVISAGFYYGESPGVAFGAPEPASLLLISVGVPFLRRRKR